MVSFDIGNSLTAACLPDAEQVMADQRFGFQSYFADLTHHVDVLLGVLVAVEADGHQEVLGGPRQLGMQEHSEIDTHILWNLQKHVH